MTLISVNIIYYKKIVHEVRRSN